jgi:hypothetical protein
MATTTATKSRAKKRLTTQEHLKKAQPALADLGGAVGGGLLGALAPPVVSGFGGVALLITGAYTQKSWVTSTGAAMIVTTVGNVGSNYRTSPTGKMDAKTEMHNGKERVKSFLKSFGGKFQFWKKKEVEDPNFDPTAEFLDGLGMLDAEHLANLDQLNRNLMAQGYELAASEGFPTAYTMEYPGKVVHF